MNKKPFNVNLSDAERERLAILSEECGEVIQVIGKILRHGYESKHPNGGPTNRELLEKELGDIDVAEELMVMADDVLLSRINDYYTVKLISIKPYLHFQYN